jgi:(1->4)-alpha-D-glucan 1-alpha-D-glucosylmutase
VLATTLLKLASPGVPDIYQGDELPFFALVDPDNRRAVDWEERRRQLAAPEPAPKLDLIRRTLELRARRPAAFAGSYEPLDAGEDVCAFVRGGEVLVAVAVRGELGRFAPPAGKWRDVHRTPALLLAERA